MAILVSIVHAVAMIAAGGSLAWVVYRYLGLKFVSRSWFNLDTTWAFSLILVGGPRLPISLANRLEVRRDPSDSTLASVLIPSWANQW